MSESHVRLQNLEPGQRVRGLLPERTVTVVGVDMIDSDVADVVFRDESGVTRGLMLSSDDMGQLEIIHTGLDMPPFDADPEDFRLVSEASRIKYAALYDPMIAVNSSHVDPLPHQIRAVYEEMLPRIPLRFLLADDPGAGKTIMAGLYLKELILRSDCDRAIVVAPGGLVEQWHEELQQKFNLNFEVFRRPMVDDAQGRNVFLEHPYLIARMDQISRDPDLMEQMEDARWDVAIVDEAHRMSAHYSSWGGEVKETKRFSLGRLLSETAHNLLLMTATPHAGKEEDFQLFMSLLDKDRFEGQFRQGVHRTDTQGLMRRMVKEDLLTFEGKPLFPERHAFTVEYELSPAEYDLYEQVTSYVREEMGRADRIAAAGDKRRGNNVGFALTVLQRRLASSPEAILRSLERRRDRLSGKLRDIQRAEEEARIRGYVTPPAIDAAVPAFADALPAFSIDSFDDIDDETTEDERAEFETRVEEVVDLATAAQTIPELQAEIAILDGLVAQAKSVRHLDKDEKWVQLRSILDDHVLSSGNSALPHKIIVFTEHRDTLNYLQEKITSQFGRSDAVITIHGGTSREARKAAREQFTHDPHTVVLLATDAAGEGLNLQRANLMVNYDLPWNPNRIEQRFGRIHRIGQKEVCYLWNLVAKDTREGEVFKRLLSKIETMAHAYNGNLFNVLGDSDAFENRSLRDLLIEAIRYGDRPEIRAQLNQVIDKSVSAGLDEMVEERALHPEMFTSLNVSEVRARMEAARERRLQPGYIAAFTLAALTRLGGRVRKREAGRYEITRVPQRLIHVARRINRWEPLAEHYERIAFDIQGIQPEGVTPAELIAPGHPLLRALIEVTATDLTGLLMRGTVLIDRRAKQGDTPRVMYTVEQKIQNSAPAPDTVSHHFDYVLVGPDGAAQVTSVPPYLDYDAPRPEERETVIQVLNEPWLQTDRERVVRAAAYREGLLPRMKELNERISKETERTRREVHDRLVAEINHWDAEAMRLEELERGGTVGRIRADAAYAKARALDERLTDRLHQLDLASHLTGLPAVISSMAVVVPSRMLPGEVPDHAKETAEVDQRAVAAVLAAEQTLGRTATEMAHNNPGYDIRSVDPLGRVYFIEVKGRIAGARTFSVTANEVTFAQTQGERHRLALVLVSSGGVLHDQVRYVGRAFDHMGVPTTTRAYTEDWDDYWVKGSTPF